MPNLQTYNFQLPNNEVKSSGPFRTAYIAAYHLLKNTGVEYVTDNYGSKYMLAPQTGYVVKNGHELKVE